VLVHSLAFGTLKPYVDEEGQPSLTRKNLEMTIDVMANSLVYWSPGLPSEARPAGRGLARSTG
jgi:enoyl-[acyl-carrier protein] reductase III